jgi:hypothetical protein
MKITVRDRYGWPVELIIKRHFLNMIRIFIHGNIRQTFFVRHNYKTSTENDFDYTLSSEGDYNDLQ